VHARVSRAVVSDDGASLPGRRGRRNRIMLAASRALTTDQWKAASASGDRCNRNASGTFRTWLR
jgi:hypothetical protein